MIVGLYTVVDSLTYLKKENIAFRIFPYFHWHSLIYLESDKLSIEEKITLSEIYSYSPNFHRKLLSQLSPEQRTEREHIVWNKDPWRRNESFLPQYYLERKDSTNLERVMNESLLFFQKSQKEVSFQKESINSKQKELWSRSYIFLAEVKQKEGNLSKTAEYLVYAHFFDAWSIAQPTPLFFQIFIDLEKKQNLSQLKDFLLALEKVPGEYWGDNRETVAGLYFEVISQEKWEESSPELTIFIQEMVEVAPWSIRWFQEYLFSEQEPCLQKRNKTNPDCASTMSIFNAVSKEIFNSKQENEFFDKRFYKRINTFLE